ncbi:hypothetical protein [Desulfonatronospira sp.]|uniref:hypothetical protein n=1 Tax=Desulfonatronospira sp. TaxID=1962951 RepID=UPI0025BA4E91|nr:hypothetical protein [Desulfonatronospira sp.]
MGKKTVVSVVLAFLLLGGGTLVWHFQFRDPPVEPDEPGIEMYPVQVPEDPADITRLDPLEDFLIDPEEEPLEDAEDSERLPEDQVITDRFVQDLANLIFRHYHPGSVPGGQGVFTLSFKELNMHYATELTGLQHQSQEVLQAREEILGHLLQPRVIDLVVDRYGPELFERLVYLGQNEPREVATPQGMQERLLSSGEIVEMLEITASRLEYLAYVFSMTAQEPGVLGLVQDYLDAVEDLNSVYFEYWQVEESDDDRRSELASRIKQLIMLRENIRSRIVDLVSKPAIAEAGHDVVYEAQWIYRRVEKGGFSRDSIQAMARGAEDLAGMARDKADGLVQE